MWSGILKLILGMVEKNPALLEELIMAILNLFNKNPALLERAVTVGIQQAEASQANKDKVEA